MSVRGNAEVFVFADLEIESKKKGKSRDSHGFSLEGEKKRV